MTNKRRYPRIFLAGVDRGGKLTGTRVRWSNGVETPALDLSHMGVAAERPSGIDFEKGQELEVEVIADDEMTLQLKGRVARVMEDLVAFEILNLSGADRKKLTNYLDDRMIGLELKLVNANYYGPGQNFDSWYHGPNDTNIFLWKKGNDLQRAIFEIDGGVLFWEEGLLKEGTSNNDLGLATEDYVYNVIHEAERGEALRPNAPLVKRAKEVLSQARHNYEELDLLVQKLEEAKK